MADVPPSVDSGAAGTEYQTIEALRRTGNDIDTIWADSLPHRIKHGNLHYLFELPHAYRNTMLTQLKRVAYDVVHVNQPHGYLAAKTIQDLQKLTIFIHRSHGFESRVNVDLKRWREIYDRDKRSVVRRLGSRVLASALEHSCRSIARFADGHIVSASECRDFLRERMQVSGERIALIPQAVGESFLNEDTAVMTKERAARILYVGQFAFVKAPMLVAEVFNRLAASNKQIQFTWVCSKAHHAEVQGLLSGAVRERLQLMDWMPQTELVRIYDAHGIFVFPSFFEGFGKAFLEAMARGLCVVAADNGGAKDLIKNEVNGLLTATGMIEPMSERCLFLVRNYEQVLRMSQAATETARLYTWDKVAAETMAFYRNRLESKAREHGAS